MQGPTRSVKPNPIQWDPVTADVRCRAGDPVQRTPARTAGVRDRLGGWVPSRPSRVWGPKRRARGVCSRGPGATGSPRADGLYYAIFFACTRISITSLVVVWCGSSRPTRGPSAPRTCPEGDARVLTTLPGCRTRLWPRLPLLMSERRVPTPFPVRVGVPGKAMAPWAAPGAAKRLCQWPPPSVLDAPLASRGGTSGLPRPPHCANHRGVFPGPGEAAPT